MGYDTDIVRLGSLALDGGQKMAVTENFAYVVGHLGLTIINISDPAHLQPVSTYPGSGNDITLSGNLALIADNRLGLEIIDISDPAAPRQLAHYKTPLIAKGVTVSGSFAFVADTLSLQIIDISNPTDPRFVGSLENIRATDVAVSGNFAYVTEYSAGLQVIDISDPTRPRLMGAFEGNLPNITALRIFGNLAYVCNLEGIVLIDISYPADLRRIGRIPSHSGTVDVAVSGKLAYTVGSSLPSPGVGVFDISDPARPTQVNKYDTLPSGKAIAVLGDLVCVLNTGGFGTLDWWRPVNPQRRGWDIPLKAFSKLAISGEFLFGAANEWGLQTFELQNSNSPLRIGFEAGVATAVAISGQYAYVADGKTTGRVIDLSDLAAPRTIGYFTTGGDGFFGPGFSYRDRALVAMAVHGKHLFVADWQAGLQVYDVSNPSSPVRTGGHNLLGADPVDIAVTSTGRHVLVAGAASIGTGKPAGLFILEMVNPTNPTLITNYTRAGGVTCLELFGDLVYLADSSGSFYVLDIKDPAQPQRIGQTQNVPGALGMAVSGDLVCVASWHSGLMVIDVSHPTQPKRVGTYNALVAEDVAISERLAYVAVREQGLAVIDIANPTNLTRVGGFEPSLDAQATAIVGSLAIVADGNWGLKVLDISNPASPRRLGSYNTPGSAQDVAVSGNLVYVADLNRGVAVVDISDPANPRQVGGFEGTGGNAFGITASGNLVYVSDSTAGIVVLDATNPADLRRLGAYDTPGNALGVVVSGNLAYVADSDRGLQVIDVSNPAALRRVGRYDIPNGARMVALSGQRAYVADYKKGVHVLDISNPFDPRLLSSYMNSGQVHDIALSGNLAYLASVDGGLRVLDIDDPTRLAEIGYGILGHGTLNDVVLADGIIVGSAGSGGVIVWDEFRVPGLQLLKMSESGQYLLQVEGPRVPQQVQMSHALDVWENLQVVTPDDGPAEIMVRHAAGRDQSFYRTVRVPYKR